MMEHRLYLFLYNGSSTTGPEQAKGEMAKNPIRQDHPILAHSVFSFSLKHMR